jgi:hypothetical protein
VLLIICPADNISSVANSPIKSIGNILLTIVN